MNDTSGSPGDSDDRRTIAPPEPDLTPDELIARAVALRGKVRAARDEADALGHYPEELHREFLKAGFYRTLQPRMFGGYEFDYATFFKAMIEISTGDPGIGWCLTLASSHAVLIASHFPESCQRAVFGPDGEFRAPHRAGPSGTIAKADGGYIIDGTWNYASGMPYATHFIGTVILEPDGAQPKPMVFVVPRDKVTVLDDWSGDTVLGMRASGSNSVRLEQVFVPDGFAIPHVGGNWGSAPLGSGTPGTRLHGNPMYLGRLIAAYQASLVAPAIGAARAALEEFEDIVRTRKTFAPPQVPRFEHFDHQRPFGRALVLTDSAETLMLGTIERYMEFCRRWQADGSEMTAEDNGRLWGLMIRAGHMACDAVETLFYAAGSFATRRDQPLQRYYRDVAMYRGHISTQELNVASGVARLHFGGRMGFSGF